MSWAKVPHSKWDLANTRNIFSLEACTECNNNTVASSNQTPWECRRCSKINSSSLAVSSIWSWANLRLKCLLLEAILVSPKVWCSPSSSRWWAAWTIHCKVCGNNRSANCTSSSRIRRWRPWTPQGKTIGPRWYFNAPTNLFSCESMYRISSPRLRPQSTSCTVSFMIRSARTASMSTLVSVLLTGSRITICSLWCAPCTKNSSWIHPFPSTCSKPMVLVTILGYLMRPAWKNLGHSKALKWRMISILKRKLRSTTMHRLKCGVSKRGATMLSKSRTRRQLSIFRRAKISR